MRYRNTKTGFEFETSDEIVGKDWVKLSPSSAKSEKEEQPARTKRTKKDD